MEQNLQTVIDIVNKNIHLSEDEKVTLVSKLKETDKKITITEFKLDRTEKVKRTTAILLEETIEELEQKRKAVEAQNKELEIESSLERVRTIAMSMNKPDDMLDVCKIISHQLELLNVKEIRNVQTAIFYKEKGTYMNYEYYAKHDKTFITETSYTNSKMHLAFAEQMLKGNSEVFISHINGDEVKDWIDYQKTTNVFIDDYLFTASSLNYYWHSLGPVALGISTYEPLKEEDTILFKRFVKVFELAYRRYLDIEKAEAQARESQIQLALERVRARTMAMQKSNELTEAASLLFKQVQLLDLPVISCGFNIWQKEDKVCNAYMSDEAGLIQPPFKIPLTESPVFIHFAESRQNNESFYTEEMSGDALAAHYKYMLTLPVFAEIANNFFKAGFTFPDFQINNVANFTYGNLIFITYKTVSKAHEIFQRFAKVFEQTYTRFLDLQKAEEQAREARIETTLERVRSRSMGMQKSEELKEVIQVVYDQFVYLNINVDHAGFVVDYIPKGDWHFWIADKNDIPSKITHPYFESVWANQFDEAKEKGSGFFATSLNFEEKNKFYKELLSYIPGLPEESKNFYFNCPGLAASTVLSENVSLYIENFSGTSYTNDENTILMRFGKVFQQTYTRFLDLQKAEAQAREAQIEAALERTRTQSMIMQHSKELDDTLRVFHEQVLLLGIDSAFSFLWLPDEEKERHIFWAAWAESVSPTPLVNRNPTVFKSKAISYPLDRNEPATAQCIVDWKGNEPIVSYHVPPAGVANYFAAWQELIDGVEQLKPEYFSGGLHYVEAFMKYGCFGVMVTTDLSEDEKKILGRFAIEFERTYTRFLDLQKAEAQAREAQIEASLERIRSKTMAMHNSNDVGNTVAALFSELMQLGVETIRCGIGIISESKEMEVWTAKPTGNNTIDLIIGHINMDIHPLLQGAFLGWKNKREVYSYVLEGVDLINYFTAINNYPNYPVKYDIDKLPQKIFHNEFHFPEGTLFAFSIEQLTEEKRKICKRFASVFGQTYRRYLDLLKAEAQSREAQIETALERVRSRTLAMQKSNELAETSAVLFKQLIGLGIKPNRLYISIIKDEEGETEFWITDEAGSKVSMAYADNLNNNPSFKKMIQGWIRQKKSLVIDMKGKALANYFNYLSNIHVPFKDGLKQKRRLQYIAYFNKGFIGMASPDEQPEETVFLLERFAAVFNLTFTRFNDLKIAEAHAIQAEEDLIKLQTEKRRAEDALSELKETQKQLIQSEKMASLGELTAGIAHEIQNPLNFVNNFSEVSKELLDEMKIALENDDKNEVKEIANDVIQNLEKINHHGKRADAIVKGMLQHSRPSTAEKESTDINALADEYLRLSYHGMRAKDKTFNATLKTDYDESIGKISIISQDISRVLLNLLNNAFYAVNEKEKNPYPLKGQQEYEPMVSVSTKSVKSPSGDLRVSITVSDNGSGISKKVLDKIFQPFFTTKPTGQGTGLGLSLSYDIVKAHGGEIKVETSEGEGTEFIIQLPVFNSLL